MSILFSQKSDHPKTCGECSKYFQFVSTCSILGPVHSQDKACSSFSPKTRKLYINVPPKKEKQP
jgi:hypothetical protein